MRTRAATSRKHVAGFLVVCSLVAGCTDSDERAERDETGEVVKGADTKVFELQPGDCVDAPDKLDTVVDRLPVVRCDEPHTHEISLIDTEQLGSFDLYPGAVEAEAAASELCWDAFETYVGEQVLESQHTYTYLYPTLQSWENGPSTPGYDGDRTITCFVVRQRGAGSLEGSGPGL